MVRKSASKRPADDEALTHIWTPSANLGTALIAVDPGDRWTGVAFFARDEEGKWYCQDAQEFDPHDFEDALAETLFLDRDGTPPPIIVYEKWRLYADHAREKTGSEFDTSQHIGVIKYLVRVHNDHVDRHEIAEKQGKMMTCELEGGGCADPKARPQRVEIVKQPADIKKPTRGILNQKKIKSVAGPIAKAEYGGRDHIKDAELHGWHHIMRTMEEEPAV